ncbi:ribonuclease [Metamycoplasma phocicerebrale]|uniref:Ribonuclease n=2 Tax=Metamycoplasma phocicerebrale TaxID=142649 RepID=A0A3Q9VBX8_9BACT|nr:ribonuclease [Metamycoplasma phocicerebrale]
MVFQEFTEMNKNEDESNKDNYKKLLLISIDLLTKIANQLIIEQSNDNIPNPDPNPNPNPNLEDKKSYPNSVAPTINSGFKIEYDNSNSFYESLNGLSGQILKDKLFELQRKHRNSTGDYGQLHVTYRDSFVDKYYENDKTVLDLYTEIPNGKDKYTFEFGKYADIGNSEGQGMNREHLIAQSWFGKQSPMRNDAHHVWPGDKYVNARHGNVPFGTVTKAFYMSSNGTKVGKGQEDGGEVAEPINEFKGDVARAHLYFALTYKDKSITNNGSSKRFFDNYNNIRPAFLKTMLEWAKRDNISQFDIDRNNGIYIHQRNRNPFIDYPELIRVYFENDNDFVFVNKGIAKKLIKNS